MIHAGHKKPAIPGHWLLSGDGKHLIGSDQASKLILHVTGEVASIARISKGRVVDQCSVVRRKFERDKVLMRRVEDAAVAAGVARQRGRVW